MRLSDHLGLKPSDIHVTGNKMSAKLTRSKTTGDDKDFAFCMVHITSCCFMVSPSWLSTGWALLRSLRLSKGFPLPAPASKCNRVSGKSCGTTFASQRKTGILASLQFDGQCSLTRSTASCWTPHSARSFLPSATAALGVPKEQRDCLGGWSAEGNDSYTRVAGQDEHPVPASLGDKGSSWRGAPLI